MIIIKVILAGTLVLASGAVIGDQGGDGYGFPSAHSGEHPIIQGNPGVSKNLEGERPEASHVTSESKVKSKKIPVNTLPKNTVTEVLNRMKSENKDARDLSIENVAFIATFDRKGNIGLIATPAWDGKYSSRTENITIPSAVKFPIENRAILGIKPFATVSLKGSHYIVLIPAHEENGVHVEPVILKLPPPHPCPPDYQPCPPGVGGNP